MELLNMKNTVSEMKNSPGSLIADIILQKKRSENLKT